MSNHNRVRAGRGMALHLGGQDRVVYLRGVWFPLDSPERKKFWLLARAHACAVCKHRSGRSAWRSDPGPKHCREVMQKWESVQLHRRATEAGIEGAAARRDAAVAQLKRWGHKPIHHCLWGVTPPTTEKNI